MPFCQEGEDSKEMVGVLVKSISICARLYQVYQDTWIPATEKQFKTFLKNTTATANMPWPFEIPEREDFRHHSNTYMKRYLPSVLYQGLERN